VVEQQYLPDGLTRGTFYSASERGWEAERADALAAARAAGEGEPEASEDTHDTDAHVGE